MSEEEIQDAILQYRIHLTSFARNMAHGYRNWKASGYIDGCKVNVVGPIREKVIEDYVRCVYMDWSGILTTTRHLR